MEKIPFTTAERELLFSIPLLRELPSNVKYAMLDKLDFSLARYSKGERVVGQGTLCNYLYVLLRGRLKVDFVDGVGNSFVIENIVAPRTFATPHLFGGDNHLPATFTTLEESTLLTATRDSVFSLISIYPDLLRSFLHISGCCNKCTTVRLHFLSYKSVRSRFISYLLDCLAVGETSLELIHNQAELAEYLNVTRPALSKEINLMIKEGLIGRQDKTLHLLDIGRLKSYML